MLVIILCNFRVPFGKYFFKIHQSHSPGCLEREWLKPHYECVTELSKEKEGGLVPIDKSRDITDLESGEEKRGESFFPSFPSLTSHAK